MRPDSVSRKNQFLTPFQPPKQKLWRRLFQRTIEAGSVIHGRGTYRILRLLGEGGMGKVFLAEKLGVHGFNKLMAIKLMPKAGLSRQGALMFLDEAKLTANLTHPNIIQTFQLVETRHDYWYVMEHVFGVTLLDFIERHAELKKRPPVDYSCYIITRILSGLHYAHNKQSRNGEHLDIVHRDICPQNIMISYRGVPKLADFGVAKAKTSHTENEQQVTFGKYPYMAPEQVLKKGTEPRSDLYSLGLVMYELFSGAPLHEAANTSMLVEDLKSAAPPPDAFNEDVPPDLSHIIMKAIRNDKDKRYKSAKNMRVAMESFMLQKFMFPDQDGLADYLTTLYPDADRHRWW